MRSKLPASPHRVPDISKIEPFRERLGVWLSYAGSAYYQAYREALKPVRLRPSWVTALAFITRQPGITQSQLGRFMAINRASAMALAANLESEGLVSRTPAQGRNQTILALTPQGATALREACDIETALTGRIMANFDTQARSDLIGILQDILHAAAREPSD